MNRADFARRVGISPQYVTHMTRGRRGASQKNLPGWADALKLDGLARQHFLDLASLSRVPKGMRGQIEHLMSRLASFELQRLIYA